jgi:hypothetical protein
MPSCRHAPLADLHRPIGVGHVDDPKVSLAGVLAELVAGSSSGDVVSSERITAPWRYALPWAVPSQISCEPRVRGVA